MNTEIKRKRVITILGILTGAVVLFIWHNSLASIEESAELSIGMLSGFLRSLFPDMPADEFEVFHNIFRKFAHFAEFFVLGALLAALKAAIDGKILGRLLFMPLFASLFVAETDEFIQFFTGRGSDVRDVMLDFSGAVTGIALMLLFLALHGKRKRKKSGQLLASASENEKIEKDGDISLKK